MGQKRLPANALLVSFKIVSLYEFLNLIFNYNEQFAPMLKEIQWVLDHRHCGIQIQFLVYSEDPNIDLYDF